MKYELKKNAKRGPHPNRIIVPNFEHHPYWPNNNNSKKLEL
jgi:hypothetical protein